MKTLLSTRTLAVLFSTLAISAMANPTTNAPAKPKLARWKNSAQKTPGPKLAPGMIKQDAHTTQWHSAQILTNNLTGELEYRTNNYIEVATGLNFKDATGQWQRTREEFISRPSAFVAENGSHKVILAREIHSAGSLDVLTPNGARLRGHVLGIDYYDPKNGKSVLLAQTRSSRGVLTASNEVVYPNAFRGLNASVRYVYLRSGLHQDVIFQEMPPTPESLGLSSDARLEILTEWLPETPEPIKKRQIIHRYTPGNQYIERDFEDAELTFSDMRMGPGFAFEIVGRQSSTKVEVGKRFENIQGRRILIEAVPFTQVKKQLSSLPVAKNDSTPDIFLVNSRVLPQSPLPQGLQTADQGTGIGETESQIDSAFASVPRSGLVVDFELINVSGGGNWTFSGDNTYLVSGPVYLPWNTVIEGGTVIKFTPVPPGGDGAKIVCSGTLECRTTGYHPAILTSREDDSVGEMVSIELSSPEVGFYGNPAIELQGILDSWYDYDGAPEPHYFHYPNGRLHDLRISFAKIGISLLHVNDVPPNDQVDQIPMIVRNVQIVDCETAIDNNRSDVNLQNGLVCNNTNPHWASGAFLHTTYESATRCENVTLNQIAELDAAGGLGYLCFTNSLLMNVADIEYAQHIWDSSDVNLGNGEPGTIFASAGAGNYYLVDDSPYREVGTTSIDPELLEELQTKTTHAPEMLTAYIVENLSLGPTVPRNTGPPDLGYHYYLLDYVIQGIQINNSKVTIKPTTKIALHISDQDDFAIGILPGGRFVSEGYPADKNVITWANSVQESLSSCFLKTAFDAHCVDGSPLPPPSLRFRFTDLPTPAGPTYHFAPGLTSSSYMSNLREFVLQDCTIRGGYLLHDLSDSTPRTVAWTNNLFERVYIGINGANHYDDAHPQELFAFNNLFYKCNVSLIPGPTGDSQSGTSDNTAWKIKDNMFDECILPENYYPMTGQDYNAYVSMSSRLQPLASHNVALGGITYYASPFGNYYVADYSWSDNGSRSASEAGLYHYTTHWGGAKEATSQVDIGIHYLVPGLTWQPIDTDGDGIPDFAEDRNGNGIKEDNETSFQVANSNWLQIIGMADTPVVAGRINIPVTVPPTLHATSLGLYVDGSPAAGTSPTAIPFSLPMTIEFDSRRYLNGIHSIQFVTEINSPDGTSSEASSTAIDLAIQNEISYPALSRRIAEDNFYRFEGSSTAAGGTFTLDVYDDSFDLSRSVSGNIDSSGNIVMLWDGLDYAGNNLNVSSSGSFSLLATVTDVGGNQTTALLPPVSASDSYEDVGSWVVSWDERVLKDEYNGIKFVFEDQVTPGTTGGALHNALDYWRTAGPLAGGATLTQLPDPGHAENAQTFPIRANSKVDRLLWLLHLGQGRNFYWFGHSTREAVGGVPWRDIQQSQAGRTYRFVFLDSCLGAADDTLLHAFGFDDTTGYDLAHFMAPGMRRPGAFLGYQITAPFAKPLSFDPLTLTETSLIPYQIGAYSYNFLFYWQSIGNDVTIANDLAFHNSQDSGLKRTVKVIDSNGVITDQEFDWDPGVLLNIIGYTNLTFNGYNHKADWPPAGP